MKTHTQRTHIQTHIHTHTHVHAPYAGSCCTPLLLLLMPKVCVHCGQSRGKKHFSTAQWKSPDAARTCRICSQQNAAQENPCARTNTVSLTTREKALSEIISPFQECNHCGQGPARLRCSNCKAVYFCSRDCQQKNWRIHKAECKQMQVERQLGLRDEVLKRANELKELQSGKVIVMVPADWTPGAPVLFNIMLVHHILCDHAWDCLQ